MLPVPPNNPPHSAAYAKGWLGWQSASPAERQGWIDVQTASASPATPPVTPPVVAPPVVTPPVIIVSSTARVIQPNENAVAILSAAVTGQLYKLVPGLTYTLFGQADAKVGGWQFDATGATLNWTLPTGPSFCIRADQPGIEVFGGLWKTPATPLIILADGCTFLDAEIADGATRAVTIESFKTSNFGTNATIARLKVGRTNSVSIFCSESGAKIIGNTLAGSNGEVAIRVSPNAITGAHADNVTIDGNTIGSVGGGNQKGAVEIRECGVRCVYTHNRQSDYLRCGQDRKTAPEQSIGDLLIDGNEFTGSSLPLNLMLKSGNIRIGENIYSVAQHPITLGGPMNLTFTPPITAASNYYNRQNVPGNVKIVGGY